MQNQKQKVKSVKSTNTTQNKICKIRNRKLNQRKARTIRGWASQTLRKAGPWWWTWGWRCRSACFQRVHPTETAPPSGLTGPSAAPRSTARTTHNGYQATVQFSVQTSVSVTPTPTAWVHSSHCVCSFGWTTKWWIKQNPNTWKVQKKACFFVCVFVF